MKCRSPFVGAKAAFACGQCMPCRLNRRRVWTHRIMLEGMLHEDNSFATLTYADDRRCLAPRDLQLWLKRLRKSYYGDRIRFFAVGEYGDRSERPHYHAALFGFPTCNASERVIGDCPCGPCSVVRETWGFGHVMLGELSISSAAYIAGYVVKKWTRQDLPALNGRHPEFARMSRRPGIGVDALPAVASAMTPYLSEMSDVPIALRHGRKQLPLGRLLRGKLREAFGKDAGAPAHALAAQARSLQLVRDYAFSSGQSVACVFEELAGSEIKYQSRGKI